MSFMIPAIGATKGLPKLLVFELFTQAPEPCPQMGLGCSKPHVNDSRLITSQTHDPASLPASAIISVHISRPGLSRGAGVCAAPGRVAASPPTMNPQPSALNPQPSILNPRPSTLNPQPSTLHPPPSNLHPPPSTLNGCTPRGIPPNPGPEKRLRGRSPRQLWRHGCPRPSIRFPGDTLLM